MKYREYILGVGFVPLVRNMELIIYDVRRMDSYKIGAFEGYETFETVKLAAHSVYAFGFQPLIFSFTSLTTAKETLHRF